jgi:hypothetical protein
MPTGAGGGFNKPLTYLGIGGVTANAHLAGANQTYITGFVLTNPLTFSHIAINVASTDAVNSYDVGVYTAAGALIANIGARSLPSAGVQTFATVQAAQTILPGLYAFAFTGNSTTAGISQSSDANTWVLNANIAASVGGALPASVGAIAQAISSSIFFFSLY